MENNDKFANAKNPTDNSKKWLSALLGCMLLVLEP